MAAPQEKGRLEDLLNDLMAMNDSPKSDPSTSASPVFATPTSINTQSNNASFINAQPAALNPQILPPGINQAYTTLNTPFHGKKMLPSDLRAELRLPANSDGTYQALRSFHQANRHRPLVELKSGVVAYVEYDVESERIRLFIGNKREFMTLPRGAREMSGILVIDEVVDYKFETKTSEILGFKKQQRRIAEKFRNGAELLRANDLQPGKKVFPVLHFSFFIDKSCGISSCSIKTESLSR